MPMQQKFDVKGTVNFPLVFPIRSNSYESAVNYAESVLNNQKVLKVESSVYTADGKIHLIICDTFDFCWLKKE
jgi:hypothetical protein